MQSSDRQPTTLWVWSIQKQKGCWLACYLLGESLNTLHVWLLEQDGTKQQFTAHYPICRGSLCACTDLLSSSWAGGAMFTPQTLFACTYPQSFFSLSYMKAMAFSSPPSRHSACKYRRTTESRSYLLWSIYALCKVQLQFGLSVKLKNPTFFIFSKE